MKRIALAILALSTVAGCAASSSVPVGESSAAIATQQTITINLKTDVSSLVCEQRPDKMIITFAYEGHTFQTDQNSQNIWGCEGERLSLENAGARAATLIEDAAGDLVTRTLLVDRWKFTSVEETINSKGTSTADVTIDLNALNARCVVKQGWFIEFTFQGRRFDGYAADDVTDCNAALLALRGPRGSKLVTELEENATKRTIVIPGSPTTFTSYDPLS